MILNKVINSYKSHFNNVCCRKYFSNDVLTPVANVLQRLSERSLIRVKGDESVSFLQGLITNDMKHLEASGSMYAMFLNIKGRVLFDTILYVTDNPKTYLIECDKSVVNLFQKHLKMYKVKRNIDIEMASGSVWVLFDSNVVKDIEYAKCNSKTDNNQLPLMNERIISKPPIFEKGISNYNDPRLNVLGTRILCPESITSNELLNHLKLPENAESTDENQYKSFRYKLGVGEGIQDLPLGVCFPLEANADYLHGVSFHKGCYIGQELTARTHHTGVVRKRFMPLLFENEIKNQINNDTPVHSLRDSTTSVGKIRGVSKNTGLGLLRIAKVLEEESLNVSEMKAKTYRPTWWPPEAPKEKIVPNVPE